MTQTTTEPTTFNKPVIKIGGPTFLCRQKGVVNLELERSFRNAPAFTHGPRLDYEKAKPFYKTSSTSVTFFTGRETLSTGYQIKAYPFYFIHIFLFVLEIR